MLLSPVWIIDKKTHSGSKSHSFCNSWIHFSDFCWCFFVLFCVCYFIILTAFLSPLRFFLSDLVRLVNFLCSIHGLMGFWKVLTNPWSHIYAIAPLVQIFLFFSSSIFPGIIFFLKKSLSVVSTGRGKGFVKEKEWDLVLNNE